MNKKNIAQFCDKAAVISETDPLDAGTVGFSAKFLVQTTLPHRDPGGLESWGRSNGKFSLVLQPGMVSDRHGKTKSLGLPYGSIPRLILPWITTEAKKTNCRELDLDKSLSGFMKKMGLSSATGGKSGSIPRFKEQVSRLLSMSIFLYEGKTSNIDDCIVSGARIQIAKQYHLAWNTKGETKEPSYVILDQDFFERIIERPIPIDLRVVRVLKSSPLALDLYSWLTYRYSYLKNKSPIPWKELMKQMGSEYSGTPQGIQGFKRSTIRALKKINSFWEINAEITKDALILYPQKPHVKKISAVK